ncbi:hypothetical protein TREMEDRAFT_72572 [Tremella mesenterica DSM 1558]|uniref:uncharacterized protein n=1 Tax=Tremella mesenterica (strain ATCC 24925 / CBS 8224 / DSM 1558 / NBRC 9311 / NRRL Y-6157 / RJB 2259-6 / UBC 559-6) TaxID=578456 RepID=UPI00032D4566|nr:uncharacterized protein TREMEDRAFT_72572 [Tremella mesenterica DSM 1558]EIW65571.1 hypothetical protein TREMEDRAFT_72572 [Tremella mesenterica DSM 1558]
MGDQTVAVKLVNFDTFSKTRQPIKEERDVSGEMGDRDVAESERDPDREEEEGYTALEAERAVWNEINLLRGPLVHLQGNQIPRLFGVWDAVGTNDRLCHPERAAVTMVVMGYAGIESHVPLETVISIYSALHRSGTLHGDVARRHVLVDPLGLARLIDFDCSRKGARSELEAEINLVKDVFG